MIPSIKRIDRDPPIRSIANRQMVMFFLVMALALLVGGCGGKNTPSSGKLSVVTTTAILADFAENVGSSRVEVRSLVPAGADVHSFQYTPGDIVDLNNADVIVSNGAGLDASLDPLLESINTTKVVHVVVSEGLWKSSLNTNPRSEAENQLEEMPEQGNPHYWLDPVKAVHYVEQIRDGLIAADPENAPAYEANATSYTRSLQDLDVDIASKLEEVLSERRHLITFHDAFGHFARRYGWEVSAFVPNEAGDVTPGALTGVIELIRGSDIPAVFAEPQFNSEVLEQVANDTGATIGTIYSDTVDSTVPTYIDMMRFNATSLVENLR